MSGATVYLATCSCRRWQRGGTADELHPQVQAHDDSPECQHVVSVYPYGPERDADFERARLARVAAHAAAGQGSA